MSMASRSSSCSSNARTTCRWRTTPRRRRRPIRSGSTTRCLLVAIEDRTDFIWVSDSLESHRRRARHDHHRARWSRACATVNSRRAASRDGRGLGRRPNSTAPDRGADRPGSRGDARPPAGARVTAGAATAGSVWARSSRSCSSAEAAFLLYRQWRRAPAGRRRQSRTRGRPRDRPVCRVRSSRRQANALLIATDERIRDARQEVDFAEAQYGAEEVVELRSAVGQRADELRDGVHASASGSTTTIPEDEATRDRDAARDRRANDPAQERSMPRPSGSASCATSSATLRTRSSSCRPGSRRSRIGCRRRAARSLDLPGATRDSTGSPSPATSRRPRRASPAPATR